MRRASSVLCRNTYREDTLMKVVIASDIHGAADYCEKLMQVIEEEQPKFSVTQQLMTL